MFCSSEFFSFKLILCNSSPSSAVSGEVPLEPVISKLTGHLFEKSLISKVILATGKCPITSKDLSEDDLLPVQGKYWRVVSLK